jgi:hypothetical protein
MTAELARDIESPAFALAEAEHLAQLRARRIPTTPHELGQRLMRGYRITPWPPKNNRSGRVRGDAMARSAKLIQGLETGTVRLVGHLPNFEAQATRWQAGQHQPDCIAAAVIAHDVLTHGGPVHIVSFADTIRRAREGLVPPPPEWMRCKIGGGR